MRVEPPLHDVSWVTDNDLHPPPFTIVYREEDYRHERDLFEQRY